VVNQEAYKSSIIGIEIPAGSGPGRLPILHFGIKPDALAIQVIVVHEGQVAAQSGMLAGDTVEFSVDDWQVCHKVWNQCWTVVSLAAEPAGDILMTLASDNYSQGHKVPNLMLRGHSFDADLHFRRESEDDAAASQAVP
jgi:hypothetical protein